MIAPTIGHQLNFLTTVESTNLYAMNQTYARMAEHGTVFYSTNQTHGRGQRGKHWWAEPGKNLAISIVLRTEGLPASHQFRLSAAMALAVRHLVSEQVSQTVSIKWPNDIFISDKKAGGLLIENILQAGQWKWSIVGIGLNVNQTAFPPDLPNAVSVKMNTSHSFDCHLLAKRLCQLAQDAWLRLVGPQANSIVDDYNTALYGRNTIHRLKKGTAIIPCRINHVTMQGGLVAGEQNEWHFEHGEVEWLL